MAKILKLLWKFFDALCYVLALSFFVWGFFRLNFTVGVFAVGAACVALGLLSEAIARKEGD